MADPQSSDGWLVAALAAVAGFCGTVILWILKRNADREDRDFRQREDWSKPLGELPARLTALVDRVDDLERDLVATRSEIAAIRLELAGLRGKVTP